MNKLQYNQVLGGAKSVKVCQTKAGQSASRRRAAKAKGQALHRFSLVSVPFPFGLVWKSGKMTWISSEIQHYSALSRSSEGWGQKALLQTRFPYFVVKYQPETSVTRKHFWPPLKANRKLETFGPCNPLQLNTVTCCQLQPYLCNSQIWPQNGLIRVRAKGLSDCPNHTTMSCPFE